MIALVLPRDEHIRGPYASRAGNENGAERATFHTLRKTVWPPGSRRRKHFSVGDHVSACDLMRE